MNKKTLLLTITACMAAMTVFAAEPIVPAVSPAKPMIAKMCANCHKAEAGVLLGSFDNIAFKAKTIQIKIDDATVLVKFDEDDIKVINSVGKTGDGDLLHATKKGHDIKVVFVENNGVKTAVKVIEKPPVKISQDLLITTDDVMKLVALGPEKGKYVLFDSRPLPLFQEGSIPTAVSLPFPAFDTLAGKLLPKDVNARVIFYCSGPTCYLSTGSADKARKLGYTNMKVYKDGMPAWLEKNYGVLSTRYLKDAWIEKNIPRVLLDVRSKKDTAKGFIKGAVAFPAKQAAKLVKTLDIKKNAPVIVYDQKGGKDATSIASALVKAGFNDVLVLSGGFSAWQDAGYDVASGKLSAKATYTPMPRPGEINLDEFKKYAAELPANVMIIDVRNPDEVKTGMLKTAKLIPAEEIRDRVAEIPKDKLIITQCTTGVRAEMAYHALRELGYTNVKFVNAKIEFEKNGTYKISKD